MMTTAPTSQTIRFTMDILYWRQLSKRDRPARIDLVPRDSIYALSGR